MLNIKLFLYRIFYKFKLYCNIEEIIKIYKYRKQKKILFLKELQDFFRDKAVFAFATGGSVANLRIENLKKLKDKNIFIMNRGIIHFFRLYGFMPNMWFVHNPDSVLMTIRDIKKYKLENIIDFSQTFIFVPSNFSNSKDCHFSSKIFKEFRELIKDKSIYVLYKENKNAYSPDSPPENYLEQVEPIEFINGSAVENTFLPWLSFIGVKTIFFSGVDHMDTGHFWDRNEYYQDINGRKLNFQDIQPNELIFECGRVARAKCNKKGISVYRLEKMETILQDYKYIEFDKAYKMASKKILPMDVVNEIT